MHSTLHSIGIAKGKLVGLSELINSEDEIKIKRLLEDGFNTFSESDESVIQLAKRAIQETLCQGNCVPSEIDAVIICTESFWDIGDDDGENRSILDYRKFRDRFLTMALIDLGLSNAHIYANWMAACSNFISGLAMAKSLVESGTHANVLVVISDRLLPGHSRFSDNEMSFFSDVAVSFIVNSSNIGYKIDKILSHQSPLLFRAGQSGDVQQHVLGIIQCLTDLSEKVVETIGRPISAFGKIIMDNLHSGTVQLVGECLQIDRLKIVHPTKEALSHAFSADCVINLAQVVPGDTKESGGGLGILNVGQWGASFVMLSAAETITE